MRWLSMVCGVVACAGLATGEEPSESTRLVVQDAHDQLVVFLLEPSEKKLAVYSYRNGRLELEVVRDCSNDLQLSTYTRGGGNRLSVKDAKAQAESLASGDRANSFDGLIGKLLELHALRAKAVGPSKPETARGLSLDQRIRKLERESVKIRLRLLGSQDLESFRESFLGALKARSNRTEFQLSQRGKLIDSLPEPHSGRRLLKIEQSSLQVELSALQAIKNTETAGDLAQPGND